MGESKVAVEISDRTKVIDYFKTTPEQWFKIFNFQ